MTDRTDGNMPRHDPNTRKPARARTIHRAIPREPDDDPVGLRRDRTGGRRPSGRAHGSDPGVGVGARPGGFGA
jgi:hypothetical protein